jgi:3'(2'), 5'-bisphosphate nucleotidase
VNDTVLSGRALDLSRGSLDLLAGVARRAGAAAMAFYGRPGDVRYKSDDSPVTAADHASLGVITQALAAWTDVPILAEEIPVPDYDVRANWHRLWIVDPLDGTKEFLAQNGEFTVNIALVDGDRPVLGVVYAPALQLMYFAATGVGAWRQRGGDAPERIFSEPPAPGARLRVVESRSHRSEAQEAFLATLDVSERISIGSSLKFCLLAEGTADVYARCVPAMEWDLAAGDCVYRCSGRTGERTSPLRYNRPDLRIQEFVIGF